MEKNRRGEAEPAKNRVFEGKKSQKKSMATMGGLVPGSGGDYGGVVPGSEGDYGGVVRQPDFPELSFAPIFKATSL